MDDLVARVVGGPPSNVGGVVVGGVLWTETELFAKLEAKYQAPVDLDPPRANRLTVRLASVTDFCAP